MTTLKEAMELLGVSPSKVKKNIANELLGKYKGIIPSRKSSGSFIKSQRSNLYGKTR